jgi:hypothetical protein
MNCRIIAVLAAVAILVCGATLLQAKDNPMGIAPKQTLTLSQPAVVAGTLLPAGEYKVTHEMQGQTHIMTFQQIDGKAKAKAKCNLVPLAEKASASESHFTQNANNERVLTEITFRGDKAKHVLEQ